MVDPKHLKNFIRAAEAEAYDPAFVLLRGKSPFQKNWQKRRPTLEEAVLHLRRDPENSAIGIQPSSIGCVVLDCDKGDGPADGAKMVRQRHGDVVACVTPSTSGRADRGHVWVRCSAPDAVKNWKFKLEDNSGIDSVEGEFRSIRGQVKLTASALQLLTDALANIGNIEEASASAFKQMRTSSLGNIDMSFSRTEGREANEEDSHLLAERL
ncbi:MAG: bifunctional DNA primase/polymerase [Pseudomonadota bacterium]